MSLIVTAITGGAAYFAGATAATVVAAAVGGAVVKNQYDQNKTAKEGNKIQQQAMTQAASEARNTATQATQAQAKVQAKKPNVADLFSANQQAAAGGAGSTMLTGAAGVDQSQLSLGRSTLLGM